MSIYHLNNPLMHLIHFNDKHLCNLADQDIERFSIILRTAKIIYKKIWATDPYFFSDSDIIESAEKWVNRFGVTETPTPYELFSVGVEVWCRNSATEFKSNKRLFKIENGYLNQKCAVYKEGRFHYWRFVDQEVFK